jgi:Double-GTPase 1
MSEKSIILLGNPDSGKSNFLGRLWLALQSKKFNLLATKPPDDIKYVEQIAAHLLQGRFIPRTDKDDVERDLKIYIRSKDGSKAANLFIPDVSGELWKNAVDTLEVPDKWLKKMNASNAALLFVRVLSDLNVQPLDWVNSQRLLSVGFGDEQQNTNIPTQVSLIELLRFLEDTLKPVEQKKPKVAVLVTAWDMLNQEEASAGPENYLKTQFPLFAGRLLDISKMEIKVFGSSVVGGDFTLEEFTRIYLEGNLDEAGYIVAKDSDGELKMINDITAPVEWLLE